MAITVKSNVTGAAWPTSGTPTNANTGGAVPNGLLIDGGTADAPIGQAGSFGAWNPLVLRDRKPAQVTAASFVELSGTGTAFQAVLEASVTDADFTTGVMMDYWIQFKLESAYDEATPTPAHLTIQELVEVLDAGTGGSNDNLFTLRINSRNVKGYAPGVLLSCAGQNSSAASFNSGDVPTGGSNTFPQAHLALDRWYRVKFWMKRASNGTANDGKLRVFVNDVLLFASDTLDSFWNASSPQRWRFLQGFSGWGGWTGVRLRYTAPIRVRVMDEADIEAPDQTLWDINTTLGFSLVRNWSALWTGPGSPWTVTGALAASVPKIGTKYSTGGVYPGSSYLPIPLTAGNGVTLTSPAYWAGDASTDPRGPNGLTHIVFNDIMAATASAITGRVFRADNTTEIVNFQVDAANATFSVNGNVVYSGIPDSVRWKVWITIGGGRCTVGLQNQTMTAPFSTTYMRCADYAYQGGYVDGLPIGTSSITPQGSSTETVQVAGISGYRKLDACLVDSYMSADAGSVPAFQCAGQRIGQNFNQHSDGTVPGGYDPIPQAGGIVGINFAICAALSGGKLSNFVSEVLPQIGAMRGVRWFLFGGDVNDIPASGSVPSMAAAWSVAEALVETKISFVQWAVARGHEVYITDGWNLRDSGSTFNGAANGYRRKIPGIVRDIMSVRIREISGSGLVTYLPTGWAVDGNAVSIDTDGVHQPNGYDTEAARAAHDAYANVRTVPGWNSDSTVRKSGGGGSSSVVGKATVVGG